MVFKDGNFGKYKDRMVEEIYKKEPHYFDWILQMNFRLILLKLKMIQRLSAEKQGS